MKGMNDLDDFLSQDEIDTLLSGVNDNDIELSQEEQDVLGEIGNISFGTAATTLYTLLRNKVTITTPKVSVMSWDKMKDEFKIPYVGVEVEYTRGIKGHNLLVLKKEDVLRITDLMMGGDGNVSEGEINELHLSAISEAMNQMIGSASTSLSTLIGELINISPPKAYMVDFNKCLPKDIFFPNVNIVKIAFKMVIGDIVDSEIMQLIPITLAKQLVEQVMSKNINNDQNEITKNENDDKSSDMANKSKITDSESTDNKSKNINKISVKPVIFKDFNDSTEKGANEKENVNLIMDIPLNITVELGRTKKLIKDILELSEGSIIELDKLAGEPVDILVNGKYIAKGEVVVIDENFGVRIIDIIQENKRINAL